MIFSTTMSLQKCYMFLPVIHFDNRDKKQANKTIIYVPNPNITVDEHLVALGDADLSNGNAKKAVKYTMKMLATCDARTNYVWNMKRVDGSPVKNQLKFVVLEIDWRSQET